MTNLTKNTVNIYLKFPGNCEAAFRFYQSLFGGEFSYLAYYRDMPADSGMPMDKSMDDKIMHMSLPISNETALLGSDTNGDYCSGQALGKANSPNGTGVSSFAISLTATDQAEADRLFSGLSAGGTVITPMEQSFWGDYFGMLIDPFDIDWMISVKTNSNQTN